MHTTVTSTSRKPSRQDMFFNDFLQERTMAQLDAEMEAYRATGEAVAVEAPPADEAAAMAEL